MKHYKIIITSILFTLLSTVALAAQVPAISTELSLISIQAIQGSHHGDELSIHITVYPSQGHPYHFSIPRSPLHWSSRYLHKLTDVKLWKATLESQQRVTLRIALVERDHPPFNPHDLIGELKLKLKNDQGTLNIQWQTIGNTEQARTTEHSRGREDQFVVTGKDSQYKLRFRLMLI